jgi:hypothetical protein
MSDDPAHDQHVLELSIRAPEVTPVSTGVDSNLETNTRFTAIAIAVVVGVCTVLGYLSSLIA